jgi:GNAT superfamily N-acetyltransferase
MVWTPRPARLDEAAQLTELCLRSKASHGYDEAFLESCVAELTVKPGLPGHRLGVLEADGTPVGLAEVSVKGQIAELEKLFVDPAFFGRGIGRALFDWARGEARSMGACRLGIDSDPGAKDFYLAMGAIEVGTSPSASLPGRMLPRLQVDLGPI